MPDPFTIRIFVPDGDPNGVRVIDKMNWTGVGLTFPKAKWTEIRDREEFNLPGIYILRGYSELSDDKPPLYIGQGDGIRNRIDQHFKNKVFWEQGIVFVSRSGGLNRAHITWLEYALIERAKQADRCELENNATPQEPAFSESEKADTRGFLNEILQILPLVDLKVFEFVEPISSTEGASENPYEDPKSRDTIVVPAKSDGFKETFLGENCWYSIRISGGMLDKIKYIAAYQAYPTSAITHYAEVDRIEPIGDDGKYKVVFTGPATKIEPSIPRADASQGSMQSSRYTTYEKLRTAKKLNDVFTFGQ